MSLKMERPRVRGCWQKIDWPGMARIAYIHYSDPIAEHVTNISISPVNHNLYPISSSSLIRITDEVDVFPGSFQGFLLHEELPFLSMPISPALPRLRSGGQ